MSFDVDAVVLWVDGNDPEWIKEKERYKPASDVTAKQADSSIRYRDWGLLPYWFRGIESFTPWIRKVHFVTWGHLPAFLNTESPKLHVVRHVDYLPEESLPTFSSHTLELNLHRIPDLAEHFIYFNDDTFLTRPLEKSCFFDERSGDPGMHFIEYPVRFKGVTEPFQLFMANDVGVINKHFAKRSISLSSYCGRFCSLNYPAGDNLRNVVMKLLLPEYYAGFKMFHSPSAFLKRTFEEVWKAEPELLKQTTMHRFRTVTDVNQWLLLMWQMASGRFVPRRMDNGLYSITTASVAGICRDIEQQAHDMICLNDDDENVDFETCSQRIADAFEKIFPDKSSFEK